MEEPAGLGALLATLREYLAPLAEHAAPVLEPVQGHLQPCLEVVWETAATVWAWVRGVGALGLVEVLKVEQRAAYAWMCYHGEMRRLQKYDDWWVPVSAVLLAVIVVAFVYLGVLALEALVDLRVREALAGRAEEEEEGGTAGGAVREAGPGGAAVTGPAAPGGRGGALSRPSDAAKLHAE